MRAAVTLCEHFQAVAAKKSQPQPHCVNAPLLCFIQASTSFYRRGLRPLTRGQLTVSTL